MEKNEESGDVSTTFDNVKSEKMGEFFRCVVVMGQKVWMGGQRWGQKSGGRRRRRRRRKKSVEKWQMASI